jgi:hypothetical protein
MRRWYGPILAGMLLAGCTAQPPIPVPTPLPASADPDASHWPDATITNVPHSPGTVTPRGSYIPSTSASPTLPYEGRSAPLSASPPDYPTDNIKKTSIVVGVVTRGGSGPCFGVQTDDGVEYALYSGLHLTLTRGQYVRLRTALSDLRVDCGSGRFRAIVAVEPVS